MKIPHSIGTLTGSQLEPLLKVHEKFPILSNRGNTISYSGYFRGCFGYYHGASINKDVKNPFYFSFPLVPVWYEDVVNDFNKAFKNIQYKIIKDKSFYVKKITTKDYYGNKTSVVEAEKDDKDAVEFRVPLFEIEFNENYSKGGIYYLRYFLHHFLRMLSLVEGYIDPLTKKPDGDLVDFVLTVNNKKRGYRSLSERIITRKDFLKLDNVKFISYILGNNTSDRRQTWIFRQIMENEYPPKTRKIYHKGKEKYVRYDWAKNIIIKYVSIRTAKSYTLNGYSELMSTIDAVLSTGSGRTFKKLSDAEDDLHHILQYFKEEAGNFIIEEKLVEGFEDES